MVAKIRNLRKFAGCEISHCDFLFIFNNKKFFILFYLFIYIYIYERQFFLNIYIFITKDKKVNSTRENSNLKCE